MDLVIPDKTLSLEEGAVDPWTKPNTAGLGEFPKRRAKKAKCGLPRRFAT